MDRYIPPPLYRGDTTDVVDVGMRDPDSFRGFAELFDFRDYPVAFASRVDDDSRIPVIPGDNEAVFLERADSDSGDDQTAYPPVATISGSSVGFFIAARYFSAAIAAVVPSPAAVVTWRVS